MSKFGNKKVKNEYGKFDSKKEWNRYCELMLLEKSNLISELSLQHRFLLQPSFTDKFGNRYRKIEYIADFFYFDISRGIFVAEDVKGVKTEVYKIKKKLFIKKYSDILFAEITT